MCLKENQTPKRHINQMQCMDLIWILIHFFSPSLSLSLSLSLCLTHTHTLTHNPEELHYFPGTQQIR